MLVRDDWYRRHALAQGMRSAVISSSLFETHKALGDGCARTHPPIWRNRRHDQSAGPDWKNDPGGGGRLLRRVGYGRRPSGAGAVVLGPSPTAEDAFRLLEDETPTAAVLDLNLGAGGPQFGLRTVSSSSGYRFFSSPDMIRMSSRRSWKISNAFKSRSRCEKWWRRSADFNLRNDLCRHLTPPEPIGELSDDLAHLQVERGAASAHAYRLFHVRGIRITGR